MKEHLAKIREAFEKVSIHSDATASQLCAYSLNEGFKALIELERVAADPPAATETGPTPIEQQAEAFRALKRAWYDSDISSDEWLELCQDFDWNEPQDVAEQAPRGAPRLLCDGCGCDKERCDAFKPPAIKCCPDCRHVVPAGEVAK